MYFGLQAFDNSNANNDCKSIKSVRLPLSILVAFLLASDITPPFCK